MQHLSVAVPGLLEPPVIRQELRESRALLEKLELRSTSVFSTEAVREVKAQTVALYERMTRLARAGYAPLIVLPSGSYAPEDFDVLGQEVSELLGKLRGVIDHCSQIESMLYGRDQAAIGADHKARFPEEMALLEKHRELFIALYPDKWLLLYDGAVRGEFATSQEAVQTGELSRGRDELGRPLFLIFCHRPPGFLPK